MNKRKGALEGSDAVRTSFQLGERAQTSKTISARDIEQFAAATGDFNPIHLDAAFAERTRFRGRIAHGLLGAGLISAVLGTELPGSGAIYLSQTLRFVRPVRIGDTLTAEVVVAEWNPVKRTVRMRTRCYNDANEDVITGEAVLLVEPIRE